MLSAEQTAHKSGCHEQGPLRQARRELTRGRQSRVMPPGLYNLRTQETWGAPGDIKPNTGGQLAPHQARP